MLIPRWFILGCALIALLFLSASVLNHQAVRGALLQRLKSATGVEVAAVRIHLVPRLAVEFWDMVARDARHPGTVVRVGHGSVTLRALPLLKKQLAVVKVVAIDPQVVIRRDLEGRWQVPLAGGTQPAGRDDEGGVRFRWLLPDVEIRGGEILIIDEQASETPREARVRNVNAILDSDLLRTAADLTLTGEFDQPGGSSGLTIDGALALAALSPASTAAPPPVRFEGSVTLEQFDPAPWIDAAEAGRPDEAGPWRTDVRVQVLVTPGVAGYDAVLSQVEGRLAWLAVRGQGRIQGIGTEQPVYSATLSSSPVGLGVALQRVPAAWIPPAVRSAVVEHQVSGTLELLSATLGGRLDRPERSDWRGVVKLSTGSGRFGAAGTPVQNLSGTVFFDEAHVEAMDVSGHVGGLRVSNGKLALSHLRVAPAVDLQLTGTGTTGELLRLLHGIGGAAAGETALHAITDPKGDVQVSIHLAGPIGVDPRVEFVDAEITGHDLGARVPEWNLSAEHLDGTVVVTPRFVELKHVRGNVGPIHFDAQGALETGPRPRFEDVTVELSADGARLLTFLRAIVSGATDARLEGPAGATLLLSGPVRAPAWKGRIDLTETEIAVPPVISKHRGVASSLEFEGRIGKDNRLTARRVALVLPSARVEGRADIRWRDPLEVSFRVEAGPIPLASLTDGFTLPAGLEGVIEASITVEGRGSDWSSWTPSGWIDVRRGKLAVDGLRDGLRAISLKLHVAGRDAMIQRLAFKVGDSDVRVRGVVKDWAGHPAPTLTLESSRLDLTRLIPVDQGADDDALERIRQWARSGRGEVTALVKQAQYHRLRFGTLSGHMRAGQGTITLDHVTGETPEGRVSGRVVASFAPEGPVGIEGEMTLDGMPVHQIISVIDPEAEPLHGLLSLSGKVQGVIRASTPFLGTLNSPDSLKLRFEKGAILHGRVLPKVLKILNLPALLKERVDLDHDGIPFDAISATVAVENGVLSSRDIVFDSPLMKVSGAGRLDMVADDLDVALAVSPLGAYSDLIGKIPLFGTLLAGNRPGLSTALFEVKGKWTDPDVRYLPIESFAKGLTGYPRLAIDVLTNVITLPGKLLAPATP